jgi:hypothetical protein
MVVGIGVGGTPGVLVPTVRVPGDVVTAYRSPLRVWTPRLGSGVTVMVVLPDAVAFTVMVARVTPVPPRGTCCDRSAALRTTCPDGRGDDDFRLAHPGNSTAVIVATEGSLRLTVIS